jgi:putative heme-binding domain-containing protein
MNGLPIIALASLLAVAPQDNEPARPRVLVYSRTLGYRHDAIPSGLATVRELGAEGGFAVDATEDAVAFTPENLGRYRAIVFLNTSGDVLDERQKAAFRAFIEGGGGLAAVHQGVTTLDKWPWYVDLVGGVTFGGHPQVQAATCHCEVREHPATKPLPESWSWTDEWYNYRPSPRARSHVLVTVDETTYQGGTMGKDHPISWYREPGKGRVWCTGLGHRKESYGEPPLRKHLLGGIRWAAGLEAFGAGAVGTLTAPTAPIARPPAEAMARFARQHPGDPRRGQAVFFESRDAGCARCHRARGRGADVGPDLSDIGGKYELDLLIESVLDPSRQIAPGYRSEVVATGDGRVFSGLIRAESDRDLSVVDVQGQRLVVAKADIEERRPCSNSLMPDGLAAGLSASDFADLIAYLQSLRPAGTATPGSGITGPVALPPGFTCERIASGLTGATAMAIAPDGRLFVCEQTGRLRVLKDGTLLPAPFVTLDVDSSWERGLIGVTLDPDFGRNGHLYVCYVARRPYTHHRVSRFTAAGDVAAPGTELVLLEGDDQAKLGGRVPAGHQGGALHFGVDGKLYVAIGDQTAGAPAQELTTFQGKLLRLNPDGSIPEDNPFYRATRGKYRAIWARGLRNPFCFAVQPGAGRIFVNDVGDNTWEEIDEAVAGGNYGWPASEGPTADPRFRGPIYSYPVASITGGAFCPSGPASPFPPRHRGRYFFADFVKGWIKVLDPDHPSEVETFAEGLMRPVDLAFGADGALYVLSRDAWVIDPNFRRSTGTLLRIRADAPSRGSPEVAAVRVSEVTLHGDMDCYKVETPSATYLYGKRGAGFASILDKDGRDWVSYRPGGNARGEYRGLPKCGQPTKYFHCGYGYGQYRTENPFASRVTMRQAGLVRIESETRDGKSACRWDFYHDHATLTLLRIDLPSFWFLYEGTPGGALDAERDFVIRPDGRKTMLDRAWSQVVPWVCFGASETPVGFVCVNHQEPEPDEVDSYVAWPYRRDEADGSFRDMTVFGFGRKGHEQLIQHIPDLKRSPARYSIAFVDRAEYATARAVCERLLGTIRNAEHHPAER